MNNTRNATTKLLDEIVADCDRRSVTLKQLVDHELRLDDRLARQGFRNRSDDELRRVIRVRRRLGKAIDARFAAGEEL